MKAEDGALRLLAIFAILALLAPVVWSVADCRHEDIDIRSGRIRHTRRIIFIPAGERIATTAVSEALQPSDYDSHAPEWHRVNTFSFGSRVSPHYVFHSAIAQVEMLALAWEMTPFTTAARRETALRLLRAWQQGRSDNAAVAVLKPLHELVNLRADQQSRVPIEVADLP